MKRFLLLSVLVGLIVPARAQLFSPESFSGAAFGAVTGAVLGGHHAREGAAIGAASGFLLGTVVHEARRDAYYGPYRADGPYGPYGYGAYAPYYNPASPYASSPPAVSQVAAQTRTAPAPEVNRAPPPPSSMSSANNLFGR